MIRIKNLITLFSVVVLLIMVLPLKGEIIKYEKYEDYEFACLKQKASRQGSVRILVKLDVPNLEVLTARSNQFRTGNDPDNLSYIQSARNADLELSTAIADLRDHVLHRLNGYSYRLIGTLTSVPYMCLSVSAETLDRLKQSPEVLRIEEDKPMPLPDPVEANNDPDGPQLADSTVVVGADVAWSRGVTGSGWYIAIVDTGICNSHEMFQGKDIKEACFSTDEDGNGLCPNGESTMFGPGSAAHDYEHAYSGGYDHGSHVAGIAAGNNGTDRFGVAPGANIIALQAFGFLRSYGSILSYYYNQIAALDYLYSIREEYKIAAVNMSLGGGAAEDFCANEARAPIITNLLNVGIATIVSSGNEGRCGSVSLPACVPGAIAVNASDDNDVEYFWGNWHDEMVDLMAPGVAIVSARASSDFSYGTSSGTSMAAPHVAGAWALIKQADESMTIDNVSKLLQDSGHLIASSRCSNLQAKPRINVGSAVEYLLQVAPPKNVAVEQVRNNSLLQTEYINEITWESNPYNAGKNITHYRIYQVDGTQLIQLGEVNASTFSFQHRAVQKNTNITYGITSVKDDGKESSPANYELIFLVTQ